MRQPHLLTVSGNRIALRRGGTYVLGREPDCDIVLEGHTCSRRHARITIAPTSDATFLEDLGSRNGTFLNGEQITGRTAVRDGDRIQVGEDLFLMRHAPRDDEIDLCETGTGLALDGAVLGHELLGGEHNAVTLLDTLQTVSEHQRSVTIHVATPTDHARIEVRGGEILSADFGLLRGLTALAKLCRQESGIYWVVETGGDCPRNLGEPTSRMLSELRRCFDSSIVGGP